MCFTSLGEDDGVAYCHALARVQINVEDADGRPPWGISYDVLSAVGYDLRRRVGWRPPGADAILGKHRKSSRWEMTCGGIARQGID
eukprot:4942153-Pyramimonas_sp.AAC.1